MPRHVPLDAIDAILYSPVQTGHLVLAPELTRIVEQLHTHPVSTIRELAGDLQKPYHTTQQQIWHLLYYAYREQYGELATKPRGRMH